MAPLSFLYFKITLRFCFENRFIKCSLLVSSETLTSLYFASRIRPQCCILHVLKTEVSIHGGGGGGGEVGSWGRGELSPLFSGFSGSAPGYESLNFACF